ncbi:MAG: CPBP family intramembrane metalloprotease [Ferruginibacter sp.]|nr:CPBP family intramembrane metalloprotease [Ferruginibacter sp.]
MLGIIIQLAISWLIIWLFNKGNLNVLGFTPTKQRIFYFILLFVVTALCFTSGIFLRICFGKEEWIVNPQLTPILFLKGLWWNIKAVLFEELIFRGVLFYILIKKLGVNKAILISSIAFGIYHWFSSGVLGQPLPMLIIFITTAIGGFLFAYSYYKTGSIWAPIGIHLGWNFTQILIFSSGLIGNGVLILKTQPTITVSYFAYYLTTYLPIVSMLLLNFFILKKAKPSGLASS